jgi:hypothetical protein
MEFQVDKKTYNFVNITPETFAELERVARACMAGRVEMQHPAFEQWSKVSEQDGNGPRALLIYSTSFVQRVLLSLLDYMKAKE